MKLYLVKCKSVILKIIQIILGLLFVVSGWVKAIDPMGVSFKIEEYLYAFNLESLTHMSYFFTTILCATELFIGIMLLCGIYKKAVSILTLIFMLVFTVVAFYTVINPSGGIEYCGWFGDAIHLTNNETFIKNIFFLTLIIIYLWRQFVNQNEPNSSIKIIRRSKSKKIAILISAYVAIISLFIPIYSFTFLPPYDYLPFNIGENFLENINKALDNSTQAEVKLIYRNKQSGEVNKFSLSDNSWQYASQWDYVDT